MATLGIILTIVQAVLLIFGFAHKPVKKVKHVKKYVNGEGEQIVEETSYAQSIVILDDF
jgi:hypothetical protein